MAVTITATDPAVAISRDHVITQNKVSISILPVPAAKNNNTDISREGDS
jgi:hypothetical protein